MATTNQETTIKEASSPPPSSFERRFKLLAYGIGCEIWLGLGLLVSLQWFLADKGQWQGLPPTLQDYVGYGVLYSVLVADLLVSYKNWNRFLLLQSLIRLLFMFGIIIPFSSLQQHIAYPCLVLVWSIHRIVVYGYGALQAWSPEGKVDSQFLTWARFTWFLFLFPISVGLEVVLAYNGLAFAEESGPIYFYTVLIGTFLYIPGFPVLMQNMLVERNQYLYRLFLERKAKAAKKSK